MNAVEAAEQHALQNELQRLQQPLTLEERRKAAEPEAARIQRAIAAQKKQSTD